MTSSGRPSSASLALLAAWVFSFGARGGLKGLWDAFWARWKPVSFPPNPGIFVTRDQWFRFAGFELTYGLACVALGAACRAYARRFAASGPFGTSRYEGNS